MLLLYCQAFCPYLLQAPLVCSITLAMLVASASPSTCQARSHLMGCALCVPFHWNTAIFFTCSFAWPAPLSLQVSVQMSLYPCVFPDIIIKNNTFIISFYLHYLALFSFPWHLMSLTYYLLTSILHTRIRACNIS